MQSTYRKEHGAFFSLCLMAILVNAFFGLLLAFAYLLNLRSTPFIASASHMLMEFTVLAIFANGLMFTGVVGLGEWKKWGMFSLGAGALLYVVVCAANSLLLEGMTITLLILWLLAAMRHKWAFLT